jgi:hypothetical protein
MSDDNIFFIERPSPVKLKPSNTEIVNETVNNGTHYSDFY